MTKEEAETAWREKLEILCSDVMLEEILKRAGNPVRIYPITLRNDMKWVVADKDYFWMNVCDQEAEAKEFVNDMGWPIIDE